MSLRNELKNTLGTGRISDWFGSVPTRFNESTRVNEPTGFSTDQELLCSRISLTISLKSVLTSSGSYSKDLDQFHSVIPHSFILRGGLYSLVLLLSGMIRYCSDG